MKEFTLFENKGEFQDQPDGLLVIFGKKVPAVAYLDYDGNSDRPLPDGVNGEWFPLAKEFDSIMAWHGQRRPEKGNRESVKINWMSKDV